MKKCTFRINIFDESSFSVDIRMLLLKVFLSICLTTFLFSTKVLGQTTATFTASGSWTCPAGVTSATVECWGGGGGGGGSRNVVNSAGGGGGGGGYSMSVVTVVPGTSYNVIVGTGGAGGNNANGNNGNNSSFNTTIVVACGGSGGGRGNNGGGGSGGILGTGTFRNTGGNGANGVSGTGSGGGGGGAGSSGNGGNAIGMTGGTGTSTGGGNGGDGINTYSNGQSGYNYGGGGSGSYSGATGLQRTGGNGANGLVVITYNCPNFSGIYTIGSSGNFQSLTAAFNAMRICGISGPVSLVLQSDYLSSVETFPITIPTITGASATNTITIYPGATGLSISSSNTTGTLFLNGADYITIDGRVNATGTTRDLTIENTTTTGYTILLNNGATNNTIKYCNIKGRNRTVSGSPSTASEGVVWFGSGAAPGNSNNTIANCDIGPDATTTPIACIYSNASGGTTNSSNTIANCNIHDYYYDGYQSSGINCNIGNTGWTVTGNSFYHSSTITPTAGCLFGAFDCFSGDGHVISNNYIGGSGPICAGTTTINGSAGNMYNAIYFASGLSETNTCTISNNTINNISFTSTPASDGSFTFLPILLLDGKSDVTGNIIGAATGTGGITINVNGNAFYSLAAGIYCSNSTGGTISNNTIGAITINGLGAGTDVVNFFAIYVDPLSPHTISGNTIGSLSTASSIQTNSTSTVPMYLRGICFWPYGGTMNVTGNTIANISHNCSNTSSFFRGIEVFSTTGTAAISGNTIRDITSSSASTFTDGSAALSGIAIINSGNQHTISQNQVYNLRSTHTTADNTVNGIYCYNGTDIDRNLIYNLSMATSSVAPSSGVNGIQLDGFPDISTITNNMIRLGFNSSGTAITLGTAFAGIWDVSGTNNYYNNSIYIGGTGASNTPINTACIYSEQGGTRTLRNNILCNERTGTSDQHYALILRNGTATSNYNCLYRPGGAGNSLVFRSPTLYNDLTAWQAAGFDANSVSNEPGFIDEISATPNLHMRPSAGTCSNNGNSLAAVTNDFDGDSRSATPDIGADEYTLAGLVWNGNTSTVWNTSSNWTVNTIPKKADVILIPSLRPRYPVITTSYDAGSYHTTIESGGSITVDPNAKLDITGTITNNAGVEGIVIRSTSAGTGSLIHTTPLVEGTIQRYTTGSTDTTLMLYHCVSIPMDESNNSQSGLFYQSYLFYFSEDTNDWIGLGAPTNTPLDERRGYLIYYVFNNDTTYQFPGVMKAGSFSPLVRSHVTAPTDFNHGWNLVPNPYPSSIDWNAASGWTKTGIDNAIYIWNPSVGDYASYVGGATQNGGSRYIQAGQSFFVHANTTTPTFNMNNSVRLHNSTAFLKNMSDTATNELRISVTNKHGYTNELVVRFNEYATEGFDSDWDAYNLAGLDEVPDISTTININEERELSINTLPFSAGERVIPVKLYNKHAGEMSLNASGMESFTMLPPIYLEDKELGKIIDLSQNPVYEFIYQPGQEDRFNLIFNNITDNDLPENNNWLIFHEKGKIKTLIPQLEGLKATISVFDIAGKRISVETRVMNGVVLTDAPRQAGVYLVSVVSGKEIFTKKLIIL